MTTKYNKTKKYWLQLKENWFDEDAIIWLESQKNGQAYSLFYLKLMLKSIKTDGVLIRQVGKMLIPYEPQSLADLTRTDIDTVIVAMRLLEKIGLIKILSDGAIYIEQVKRLTTTRTIGAEERRVQRLKQEARRVLRLKKEAEKIESLKHHSDKTPTNVGQMSDTIKDKDIYKDINIIKDKDIYKERDIPRAQTHMHVHTRERTEKTVAKFSLSQKKFKDAFSNKKIDCEITTDYDVDLLIQKINESEWLKMLTQPLSWYLKNYNEILADKYKTVNNSKKNSAPKNKVTKSVYSSEGLNSLYTPIDEVKI